MIMMMMIMIVVFVVLFVVIFDNGDNDDTYEYRSFCY